MSLILFCMPLFASAIIPGGVALTEEKLVLPTYDTEAPDKIPLFYRPEEVQLAEKHVYPYPFYDVKATEKKDKEYVAVILENEYIKICVTPEMGGRLYYAVDKTNGYDIVYNNRVVKPALIGMIGAWTSGGVEWNTPHHHRATSLIEVDYTTVENSDGSKTIWVGEYEKRCQTRWLTGMTLEPGKSYVKVHFQNMNVTPHQYPALNFANTAVHVNDQYQFIFPPDVEMMNFHYVTEFTRWPVPNQVYQSTDYTHGEDLSWWNAAKQPVSFFVTRTKQDFMGGIDHDKKAGIALVGDHRIFKGKKLWNWGKNEVQAVWDQKLTDADGPYAELMMGFYSDNQPDYNFLAPFETKYGDMYLYGIKGMSGIKEADKDFAINLQLSENRAVVEVNATSVRDALRVVLANADKIVFEETTGLSPTAVFTRTIDVAPDTRLEDLRLTLFSPAGVELMTWQKQPPRNDPFPEPCKDPLSPEEYTSSQELYYAGLKVEQFGNTNYDYMKYYEAALKLNPNDVPTNTQLGLVYLKRGEYAKSEEHLRRAVEVVTGNHKKAQDATSLFYLGVCLMKQGRMDEALDMLYRSTWAYEWTSAGYTLAAQLEASQKRWERALDAAERACSANTKNIEALLAKAIILRTIGRPEEAHAVVKQALIVDPLSFVAMNERRLLSSAVIVGNTPDECMEMLVKCLREEPGNYMETAARYSALGLFGEAADIMRLAADSAVPQLNTYPMVHYHLGLYLALDGNQDAGDKALTTASTLSTDLCFPYGDESKKALQHAISRRGDDATAHYLLGNLLADFQHDTAIAEWQKALELGRDEAIIHRNIAYLQANHLRDMPGALANIMKAISLDPSQPRYFSEAHLYMSYASLTPQQLTDFLAQYGEMGKDMTDIQLMAIRLNIFNGKNDDAIRMLEAMTYHIKEGATFNPHVYWFDAHLQKGISQMEAREFAEAEKTLLKGMEFPRNLEAERDGKIGIAYYYLGLNAKQSGDTAKASEFFPKMQDSTYSQGWGAGDFPELEYFKTLASVELGKSKAEAEEAFRKIISDGENRLVTVRDGRHITVSVEEAHGARTFLLEREIGRKDLKVSSFYLQGLGHLGLGDKEKARAFFSQAMETEPLSLDPKRMLESLD